MTASTSGIKVNTTSPITSNEAAPGAAATATLTVTAPAPPTFTKAFTPATISLGGPSTLVFTITNPNAVPLNGVAFTDVLPAGVVLTNGVQGGGPQLCNFLFNTTPGSISASNLVPLPPGATCTILGQVTGTTLGPHVNITSPITSNEAPPGAPATATLTVAPPSAPTLTKAFTPATISVGGTSALSFTVTNPNGTPLTGIAFSDTFPAGVAVATPNGLTGSCGGGSIAAVAGGSGMALSAATLGPSASCTFQINVTASTAGTKVNSTSVITSNEAPVPGAPATATLTVSTVATTTTLTSSKNPSSFGEAVTFTATVTGAGGTPTGTVTFKDGATVLATVPLSGTTATFTTSSLTGGAHSITATYNGDANFTASTSGVLVQTVGQATTATALVSSLNPSEFGKPVTFTATVTSSSGTPTGTVTFNDGGVAIGTTTLAAGIASFTTSSLTIGSHAITASYAGTANFGASTSPILNQAVNTPADSLKLRALQVLVTPTVAQVSGQAISGAVDSAIGEAFGGGGAFIAPSASGVRFNFAADPEAQPANTPLRSTDPFTSANGTFASNRRGLGPQPGSPARIDDTFNALGYAGPTKAPPLRVAEPREWLGWAEVRGATLDRWGSLSTAPGFSTVPGATVLYGNQVNLLAGLTRKFTPNFLVGVLGGYETFDYRSDALLGRLKGDGWTVGSYLGWKITQGIRFDAGVAYSGIGYDGTAGTAAGSFNGNRWLVTSGLTGAYSNFGIQIEPSARVYALWEHENAYTDTLGTLQTARDFSTGRASGGVKLAYPVPWSLQQS